jgi:hypothetical protein
MRRTRTRSGMLALVLVVFLLPAPLRAQTMLQKGPDSVGPHFCGTQSLQPEFRQALSDFQSARASGTMTTASKSASPPDVGDRQDFRTFSYKSNSWVSQTFELRDKTSLYYAWVEVSNLSQITAAELLSIRSSMLDQTPAGSINPAKGVMANNNDVFGFPPDVDGDGIVDFLFYDIDNQNVGGFVSSADLNAELGGNGKDVLHLDIFQSLSFMPRLIAHEYTHLIHFNYDFDVETFVSEGLAEFAMVVNGYIRDNFEYLGFPSEQNKPLFSWRGVDSPFGGRDYDRGRLFFSYMSERVGPLRTGEVVRMENKGAVGMDSLLVRDGLSLGGVITDFHTANWVSDTSVDPVFGYLRPFSLPLAVLPATQYATSSGERFTPEVREADRPSVEAGAVNYIRWSQLANLSLNFDGFVPFVVQQTFPEILEDVRSRLRGRIVATRDDGRVIWMDITASRRAFTLKGNYTEVKLLVTGSNPLKSVKYTADASWSVFGTATATEATEVPGSFSISSVFPNPVSSRGTVVLELSRPSDLKVSLVDPLGRQVFAATTSLMPAGRQELPLDISALVAGPYLLVVETSSQRRTAPLVVIHR